MTSVPCFWSTAPSPFRANDRATLQLEHPMKSTSRIAALLILAATFSSEATAAGIPPPRAAGSDPAGAEAVAAYCARPDLDDAARKTITAVLAKTRQPDCRALFNALLVAPVNILTFSGQDIRDVGLFAYLPRVTYLELGGNRITDAGALLHMRDLNYLGLRDNLLTDLRPLVAMTARVGVTGNPVKAGAPGCPVGTGNVEIDNTCFDRSGFEMAFNGAAPARTLPEADLAALLAAVVGHPAVRAYYHGDEVPGRFPVPVAVDGVDIPRKLEPSVPGVPVRMVTRAGKAALSLRLDVRADRAVASVGYPPEGMHGTVHLEKGADGWRVLAARVME